MNSITLSVISSSLRSKIDLCKNAPYKGQLGLTLILRNLGFTFEENTKTAEINFLGRIFASYFLSYMSKESLYITILKQQLHLVFIANYSVIALLVCFLVEKHLITTLLATRQTKLIFQFRNNLKHATNSNFHYFQFPRKRPQPVNTFSIQLRSLPLDKSLMTSNMTYG